MKESFILQWLHLISQRLWQSQKKNSLVAFPTTAKANDLFTYLLMRERETERERGRGRERQRGREGNNEGKVTNHTMNSWC